MFSLNIKIDQRTYNDVTNFLSNFTMNLKKQLVADTEKAAIELRNQARANAHLITGNMRNSVNYRKNGENSYTVSADIDYAVYENARGDDHAFFDNAVKDVDSKFYQIIQSGVKAVIQKKR